MMLGSATGWVPNQELSRLAAASGVDPAVYATFAGGVGQNGAPPQYVLDAIGSSFTWDPSRYRWDPNTKNIIDQTSGGQWNYSHLSDPSLGSYVVLPGGATRTAESGGTEVPNNILPGGGPAYYFEPGQGPTFFGNPAGEGQFFFSNDPAAISEYKHDARTRGYQSMAQIAALVGGAAALGGAGGAAGTEAAAAGELAPISVSATPLAGGVPAVEAAGTAAWGSTLPAMASLPSAIATPAASSAFTGATMNNPGFFQRLFGGGQGVGNGPGTPPFNPNASSPVFAKMPQGPKWLQMLSGGLGRVGGAMGGGAAPSPYLTPQENDAASQRQQMAMIGALLQASAPRPKGTGSPLADMGAAMMAGQQARDAFTADSLRAKMMQAQIAQAQQPQTPEAPSDIRAMQALGYPLTPEGFEKYNAAQGSRGTTINIGDELNKPIPIAQLDTVRLPNGQTPPIGTTYAQAREMGAQVLSAEDQKRTQQADQALGILNQIEELAVGQDGVFKEVKPGLANRAAAAIEFGLDMLEQKDPRASQYADMSQAVLAPFIKFLGETGSLAQGDVQRALGLLPRIFPLPDTGEVAEEKIKELRTIITRGVAKMNSVTRQSESIPPLPPGFTLDPEE